MTDEFDELFGDLDDELDLTLYADAAELAEEVTVQILAAIENGNGDLASKLTLRHITGARATALADAKMRENN